MNFSGETLCCCEYFDAEQQRNHILACCCNCVYLDASCDNCLRGKRIPSNISEGLLRTMQDRLRIPWYGGARKIAPDIITPVVLVPTVLVISTMGVWWTVTTFTLTLALLFYLYTYESVRRSKFFLTWTITSLVSLFLIFEFLVVPYLEILIHENVILVLILSGSIICVRVMRARTTRLQYADNEVGEHDKTQSLCSFCRVVVPEKNYHCLWIDTCIGRHNRRLSLLAVALAITFLLYNANLTLTTVCHPFLAYNAVLLPDDCSEVYEQFEYSLCFVDAVYSVIVGILLTLLLIYQFSLYSIRAFRLDKFCIKLSFIVPTTCRHWINRCCYNSFCQRTIEQY